MMKKALFLDRDGTINVDYGYVFERSKFVFTEGVFDFCRLAQNAGFEPVVITNQSGIERGYYGEEEYRKLTDWMVAEFAARGVRIADVLHCPSLDGPDRKPEPGLFLKARDRHGFDMAASVSVGDKPRDAEAGRRAGVGKNLIYGGDWRSVAEEMGLPAEELPRPPQGNPLVSLVIPVYNVEKTLARCLESAEAACARLGEKGAEIICVNDGSTDSSRELLVSLAAKLPRVRIIERGNGGLSAARNAGMDVARGKYLAFLDSDDALPPYALELMTSVAEKTGAPFVVSKALLKEGDMPAEPSSKAYRVSDTPIATLVDGRRTRSSAWNKLYLREAVGKRRFIEGILFEDWPFVTPFAASVASLAVVEAPCYTYTDSGASITRSAFSERKIESYAKGIRAVAEELRGTPSWPVARRRCAMAASMMIGKAKKTRDADLIRLMKRTCRELRAEGSLRYRDLPLKSLARLLLP